MCKQNYLKYLKSNTCLSYKKYLYAFRGLINAYYVLEYDNIPPIIFEETIKQVKSVPDSIKNKLYDIIKIKKLGIEKDIIDKIVMFDDYIEKFLKEEQIIKNTNRNNINELNEFVYKILHY